MSFNILDAVKGHLTPGLISKIGSLLGESENGITKALSGILPTVLSSMAFKTSASNGDAVQVLQVAKETYHSDSLTAPGNFFNDEGSLLNKGLNLVKGFFGDKTTNLIDSISSFAGIKKSSATSLLSMVVPVTAGTVGKYAVDNNLNAAGLTSFFNNQKLSFLNMIPGELGSIVNMIDIGKKAQTIPSLPEQANEKFRYPEKKTKNAFSWLPWLLLTLLAGLLIWWFLLGGKSGCNSTSSDNDIVNTNNTEEPVIIDDTALVNTTLDMPHLSIDSLSGTVLYDLGTNIEFTLPDGNKFMAAEKGFESRLIHFINDGTIDTVNKTANWFNMFDVQFKTGGNIYTGKAEDQLKNCAAILKAYPGVKIKLGGYTDNTGSADTNTKISQQRADKVKADLIAMGAKADQIVESIGYGPQFPVCEANDTKECQARNRRVACKVAVK